MDEMLCSFFLLFKYVDLEVHADFTFSYYLLDNTSHFSQKICPSIILVLASVAMIIIRNKN